MTSRHDEAGLSRGGLAAAAKTRRSGVAAPPHANRVAASHVRAKVYGKRLGQSAFDAVITDVAAGHYSDLQAGRLRDRLCW